MHRIDFHGCHVDHGWYLKDNKKDYIIVFLYVDDMLMVGVNIKKINKLKRQLLKRIWYEGLERSQEHPWKNNKSR